MWCREWTYGHLLNWGINIVVLTGVKGIRTIRKFSMFFFLLESEDCMFRLNKQTNTCSWQQSCQQNIVIYVYLNYIIQTLETQIKPSTQFSFFLKKPVSTDRPLSSLSRNGIATDRAEQKVLPDLLTIRTRWQPSWTSCDSADPMAWSMTMLRNISWLPFVVLLDSSELSSSWGWLRKHPRAKTKAVRT